MPGPLFEPGDVLITRGALEALRASGVGAHALLARHLRGDWGNVPGEGRVANDRAVYSDGELGSSYTLGNGKECLIVTRDDRSLTCILTVAELPVVLAVSPQNRETVLRAEVGAVLLLDGDGEASAEVRPEPNPRPRPLRLT